MQKEMEDIRFYISFEGFYNSIYDDMVNDIIYSEIEEGYLNEDQADKINYLPIFEAMAQSIFDDIIELFIDETFESVGNDFCSTNIIYEGLHSPRFYNYSTDKLEAKISYNNYSTIYKKYIINDTFINYVNESSKSRDGFISFYEGINQVSKEPAIFLEYLFEWFVLNEYSEEIIYKTTDNLNEIIYNNLNY
jgi:6-pyruvoyl-tetrahydropterin synthase